MSINTKQSSGLRIASLFFLSLTLIAFELSVMRTFSVGSWSNFGSMVISIALLGYGLAGTLLTFLQKHVRRRPNAWLSWTALALLPAMALSHIMAQRVNFNPVMLAADLSQLKGIGAYYLIYSIPYFIGALFIGIIFLALSSQIHKLYFWNMAGSGTGGFLVLGMMYIFPPDYLILPLLVVALITAILCFTRFDVNRNKMRINDRHLLIIFVVFLCSVGMILLWGKIKVSEYKPISYSRSIQGMKQDLHSFSPTGEIHVLSSPSFHFAAGLSDNASEISEEIPENAFKALFIDGSGPIGIQGDVAPGEDLYVDYLPSSAAYQILESPKVLLVRAGGGIGTFSALYHKASRVQVVETDPTIVRLLKEEPVITAHNGNLMNKEKVDVHVGEPRAYCVTTDEQFDLVEISLIDSVGLAQTGGYSLDENYTYTVEAFKDYLGCLTDSGVLSITVWNKLVPPRNVPKVLTSVYRALKEQGASEPDKQVFVFDVLFGTATVLVKNSPFTEQELKSLRIFCRRMNFNVSYFPGMEKSSKDFEEILASYRRLFAEKSDNPYGNDASLIPGDLYHFTMMWLKEGREKELYKKYLFDIRPARDNRPYYTAYLKPHDISMYMDQLGDVSEEWGYLLLLGTFLQSILFGFLIILVPLIGRWKDLYKGRKGTPGVILYYACLGLAYMLIEIFLIQKLVFFLENPIFSMSFVITSMLIISGLGSLFSSRFEENRERGVRIAVIGIGASLVFYMFGLSPLLNLFLGLPFLAKGLISVLMIAPAAFFMGIPFPSGLAALTANRKRLVPWAWGMNGALSVTGSVLARLISISYGFIPVLVLAGVMYALAAFSFKANLFSEDTPSV